MGMSVWIAICWANAITQKLIDRDSDPVLGNIFAYHILTKDMLVIYYEEIFEYEL